MKSFTVDKTTIGADAAPFIIAEMSCNHNQSLDRALKIVEEAAKAGAHALKIQTSTPDTMTLDLRQGEFVIEDPKSLWNGASLYELYQKAYTPWEWHEKIFNRCRELGIIGFSTPFSPEAVDFLETLNVPLYKIGSFENTDVPLIKRVAKTGKPVIISTGMATAAELDETVRLARASGCKDLVLLKCTSTYPAEPVDTNLKTIPHMRDLYQCQIGLSDHTLGVGVSIAAVALGATVIERHFTLARADGGLDAAFSLEPSELATLVKESQQGWKALGNISYGPTEREKSSLRFRRSLYVAKDMKAGEKFNADNLKNVRPGFGLPSKYLDLFLGRPVAKDVKKGTPVSWELISK